MKIKKWEIALLISVSVLILSGFVINSEVEALSDKLIRIHVVANSDSEEDQALKLKVRDTVLELLAPVLESAESRSEAEQIIKESMAEITAAAENTIRENGFFYTAKGSLMTEHFPTVDYDTFSLPAGEYMSLRIIIGEGAGHNWWCVVFPSLCQTAISEAENDDMLTEQEAAFITGENSGYVIKFKIAEIIGKLKYLLFGD